MNCNKQYKTVRVWPRIKFTEYCKYNMISDSNIDDLDICLIEILNTSECKEPFKDWDNGCNTQMFNNNHLNVLTLIFDDVEYDDIESKGHLYKAFTKEQGKSVLDFINKNIDKSKFIIHCSAGISRSGAVGRFIFDYLKFLNYNVKFPEHNKINPNGIVSKTLNNLLNSYEYE